MQTRVKALIIATRNANMFAAAVFALVVVWPRVRRRVSCKIAAHSLRKHERFLTLVEQSKRKYARARARERVWKKRRL